ncbi:ABC transporter permease [Salmonella enterica]|nr:ABC transporter permease [Salmonella enterica]EKS5902082.1 ABC transporter permease [Salmonella enterica]EKS5947216.1 ABC transporter permease [Salmonella enterica]
MMARFVLWRLLSALLLLWLASMLIFFTLALAPGDAAVQALGERATPQALQTLRHQFGLDRPVAARYWQWLSGILRGDPGISITSQQPVADIIAPAARRSGLLALLAACGMLLLGGTGGVLAAMYRDRWQDRLLSFIAMSGLSTPEFIVATLMILLLAVGAGWFPAVSLLPASGNISDQWSILVLPALTLALIGGCYLLRMIRASLIRLTAAPNILSARLNGVCGLTLVARHLLPQAAGPLAQLFATSLPYLIGGAVVVERVFGFPGLGELLLTALNTRDAILLQGVAMLLALITALCWFTADILAVWLDPWRRRS